MDTQRRAFLVAVSVAALIVNQPLAAQDDVADIPSQDLRAGGNDHQRYFLVGPHPQIAEPESGFGLVVVLPGGDGSADFHPFVKRIFKHAVAEDFLLAQPVAVKWTPEQEIVWPTEMHRVDSMKFSTEVFVDAVIADVHARHKLNPQRIAILAWSSSGPAAYAISLTSPKIKRSLIAMSVFRRDWLPPLKQAKGHRYYLYHSPDDRVCPFRMAEQAAKVLQEQQAEVKLVTYAGGHGWRGRLYDDIRGGLEWLERPAASSDPSTD